MRASLNPQMVSVIPNAVVANHFIPDPSKADPNKSNIIKKKLNFIIL